MLCAVLVLRSNSHPEDVITHVLSPPPYGIRWLVTLFWIGGSFGTIAFLLVTASLAKRWMVVRDLAASAVGTLVVSGILVLALGASGGRPRSIEFYGYVLSFPVLHVALALSVATAGLPYLSRTVQRLIELIVFLTVLATVVAGHGLPANVLGSMAIGWGVTAAIHLGWGSPLGLPSGEELRVALATVGIDAVSAQPTRYQTWGAAHYFVVTNSGESLVVSFYGRDAADAQFLSKVYRLIMYRNSGPAISLTRIQQVEHESSVTQLAARSGARVPQVISASEIGPSHDAVLIARSVSGTPFDELGPDSVSDQVLDDLFAQLLDLRSARISHGAISPHTLLGDVDHGTATMVDFRSGISNATDFLLDQDLAGAMASAALVAGPERAARSVVRVVPSDLLPGAMSHLRRAGLDPAITVALKGKKQLLDELRSSTAQQAGMEVPELIEPRRLSWNQVLVALGSLVGGWALILVLINASHSISTIKSAQWGWVVATALLCATAYLGGATSNRGSVPGALPMGRVGGFGTGELVHDTGRRERSRAGHAGEVLPTAGIRHDHRRHFRRAVEPVEPPDQVGPLPDRAPDRLELLSLRPQPAPGEPRQNPLRTARHRDRHRSRPDGHIRRSPLASARQREAATQVRHDRRELQDVGDAADQDRPALRGPDRGATARHPRPRGGIARLWDPAFRGGAGDRGDDGRRPGVGLTGRRRHGGRRGGPHLGPHCCGDLEEPGDGRRLRTADLHGLPPADRWLVHPHVDAKAGIPVNRGPKTRGDGPPGPAATGRTEAAHHGAKRVIGRVVALVVTGVALYVVLPSLTAVFGAWPRLAKLSGVWLVAALLAEAASFVCNFGIQRIVLRTRGWFAVVAAGLTGNIVTNVLPGGDAAGAAVQFRMLERAGINPDAAAGGLTASSLLGVGGLLMLPILTLPAVLGGSHVNHALVNTALIGVAGFVVYIGLGILLLETDRPLRFVGRGAQWIWNKVRRHHAPLTGLDGRLLTQRDQIRGALGREWKQVLLLEVGRLGFDFLCLLASVTGDRK